MCTDSSFSKVEERLEIVFQEVLETSSEDPSTEERFSFMFDNNVNQCRSTKMALYKEGLYNPGSGEICGKHIFLSNSSVQAHVYYKYPSIKDPGIKAALLGSETKKLYSYDGQELYLDLCLKMNVVPVKSFYRGLLREEIDLRYYCVNPIGVRAMCFALVNNQYVKRLDLTSNHLSHDACYHLGQLLGDSFALKELVLAECKLGSKGLRLLVSRLSKRTLELLDLSRNGIGDDGFHYLANQIMKGSVIKRLNLSFNDLSQVSSTAFAEALNFNNSVTHLDMSWNNMYTSKGSEDLLQALGESKVLCELNFSWNALTTGLPLKNILSLKTLQVLDLSNNRLSTEAVQAISSSLQQARKLDTLDLSHNPLSSADALMMVNKMRDSKVHLKNLYIEDVSVTNEFVVAVKEVLFLKHRTNTTITYGRVLREYRPSSFDMREIVIKRLDYLTARATRKCKMDIGVFFLQAHKMSGPVVEVRDLARQLKFVSAPIDEDLLDELANCFPALKSNIGGKNVNLDAVVEYVQRLWPDRKPPPTLSLVLEPGVYIKKKIKKKKQFVK